MPETSLPPIILTDTMQIQKLCTCQLLLTVVELSTPALLFKTSDARACQFLR